MDFAWTQEQVKLREAVVRFAQENLGGNVADRQRTAEFPRALWRKCAEFGVQGWPIPEKHGGSDADLVTTMGAMESLGYGCPDNGLLFAIHAHMWSVELPILRFGTDDQKDRYLPGLCDGTLIGAHGMSEPGSGSDSFSLQTRAQRKGDRYVLNGSKIFVTNAPISDVMLVFGTVDAAKGLWGITAFLVDSTTKGLVVGKRIENMGLDTAQMGEVFLTDCEVPAENVLGAEGQGSTIFNHSMGWERSCILASMVGAMQRQLETCLRYAKERRQFGKPIGSFQLVSSKLVDMKVRLETARLLLYHTAWSHGEGTMAPLDAAMAKLYISECAVQSALDAIQIHGGYGYSREFEVERDLRDAIAGRIYSGTSEIQRLIIARGLGLQAT